MTETVFNWSCDISYCNLACPSCGEAMTLKPGTLALGGVPQKLRGNGAACECGKAVFQADSGLVYYANINEEGEMGP